MDKAVKGMSLATIDHLGSDRRVVETSRICTGNEGKSLNLEKNIDLLMRRQHWSAFEQCFITYQIECPIFVARQWMRHQQKYMERSLRYTKEPMMYPGGYSLYDGEAMKSYDELLRMGIAPEDARLVLPLDTMTKIQCTVDLRTALHMLNLRMDSHAQADTQHLAEFLYTALKALFPLSVKAFMKWHYQAFPISVHELGSLIYYLKSGSLSDDPLKRRFIENGEKRISTVKKYMPELFEGVQDHPKDSGSDRDFEDLTLPLFQDAPDSSEAGA